MTESGWNSDTLKTRPAAMSDARLLWEWANDAVVRQASLNSEAIPWESHLRWLAARLRSRASCIWILEDQDRPVGQIRYELDAEGDHAILSFSVAPEHRGRGYGNELICRTRELACEKLHVSRILALVQEGNVPSMAAFRRSGFRDMGRTVTSGRDCVRFVWQAGDGTCASKRTDPPPHEEA